MKKKNLIIFTLILSSILFSGCSDNYFLQENRPYYLDIARGLVSNMEEAHKFGNNPDIDTADGFEDIWNGGGHYTGQDPTTADYVEIYSSDINDDEGDTGARTISIFGLDNNYGEIEEIITLNGTSPIISSNQYLRLNRAIVMETGSSDSNEGTITVRAQTITTHVFVLLPPEEGQTLIGAYTIPANKTGYLLNWHASTSSKTAGSSVVKFKTRYNGYAWRTREIISVSSDGSSHFSEVHMLPTKIQAETDIKVQADSSANNIGISTGFEIILIEN